MSHEPGHYERVDESVETAPDRSYPSLPSSPTLDVRNRLAARGRSDLYFMAQGILGYDMIVPHAHAALARFVQGPVSINGKVFNRRMILMPRDHFKTTIATIAHSIQLICNDPNERILLVASTAEIAESFLKEISNHFLYNELFRWLYSELIPEDFSKVVWNQQQITVKRDTFFRTPTIDTIGARGAVHSKHFTRIKADDIIGEKEYHSDTEMEKTIKWANGLEALLVTEFDDTIDFIGTHWKMHDVYSEIQKFYGGDDDTPTIDIGPHATTKGELAVFKRHARLDNMEPFFPERVSRKFLDRMMQKDPERYSNWYANDPIASGTTTFDKAWIKYCRVDAERKVLTYKTGEEGKNAESIVEVHRLKRYVLIDPAVSEHKKACRNAIVVVGILEQRIPLIFILETRIGHYRPDEFVDHIFDVSKLWQPDIVSIEKYAYQAAIKYWVRERAERDKLPYPPVLEYPQKGMKNSQMEKDERIKGLQPYYRSSQIYFQEGSMSELMEEYLYFPRGKFRDGLDALAQVLSYCPNSGDEQLDKESREHDERVLASIGPDGYSIIPGSPLDPKSKDMYDDDDEIVRWRGVEIAI